MPTHGALIGLTPENTWRVSTSAGFTYCAYIATNSAQRLSFLTLHTASRPDAILRVASRPAGFPDMPYGVVIELHLAEELQPGESIFLSLAQSGATTYFPAQPIDDLDPR
jgi:hypothetical protein